MLGWDVAGLLRPQAVPSDGICCLPPFDACCLLTACSSCGAACLALSPASHLAVHRPIINYVLLQPDFFISVPLMLDALYAKVPCPCVCC